ncbi:MAG: hypothetical protein JRF53_00490 [Deltaproteobacteria bacterium]|nr:hypothetical protein [Deltaproteobacteria bacterium]
MEAVETLKEAKTSTEKAIRRLWEGIEKKVSQRLFLTLMGLTISILIIIVGFIYNSQANLLNKMLEQVTGLQIDMGVVKHTIEMLGK